MDLLVTITEGAGAAESASRAVRLFWATLGLLGLVFFGLLLHMAIRRAARRRSLEAARRGGDAPATDAWAESARRVRIAHIDGDADPDQDTVDFDPDDNPPRRS